MSLHDVGDAPLVRYLLVDPSTTPPTPINGTVAATLTSPTGVVTGLALTNPTVGTYTANPPLTAEGEWLVTITTTAPVPDVEKVRLYALPGDSLAPGWSPSLAHVAAHIPTRTRAVGTDNTYLMTFTPDTTPTGESVAVVIGHACAWVASAAGLPVVAAAFPACQLAASLWAAYWVEIGYPERDADVAVYDRLRDDAEAATVSAAAVNVAAGGGATVDPTPGDAHLLTVYAFPEVPAYAETDQPFYF